MKTRNTDLDQSSLLTNHICKHIVLEAPTIPELEKKIKNYKTLLVSTITNVYRITNLTLDYDGSYNASPNHNYQVGIFFNFDGKRKEKVAHPDATLHHLKQLVALESKKQKTSHIVSPSTSISREISHVDTLVVEANSETDLDDAISNKQREFIAHLISIINLTNISFVPKSKSKDNSTGKIIYTISVRYKARETYKKHKPKGEQEGR